jgi:LPXTG-motif cell wall-anchored protein
MTVTTGFDYSTILMIAGIAAIIVVVAVVGFFLYRRSRK